MAKIDLTAEVLKHDEEEIIEYLAEEMATVKRIYTRATKEGNPNLLYIAVDNIDRAHNVITAINRRNQERKLQ